MYPADLKIWIGYKKTYQNSYTVCKNCGLVEDRDVNLRMWGLGVAPNGLDMGYTISSEVRYSSNSSLDLKRVKFFNPETCSGMRRF